MSRLLREGEQVLLLDAKHRRYLVVLAEGGEFHSHAGVVPHDDLIGRPEGVTVRSSHGARYTAVRPTLSDYVLKMPRGAQVIYPKDLGPILLLADVYPGARILESGVGSGALLVGAAPGRRRRRRLRAPRGLRRRGPGGTSRASSGEEVLARYRVEIRDTYEGIDERDLDRIVLDLPEPWRVVPHADRGDAHRRDPRRLHADDRPGRRAARARSTTAPFGFAETIEVLHRSWHIEGQSVRPDHRMVAHTGFLTAARLLG